jgi:ADP-ribose pyrophosphatase
MIPYKRIKRDLVHKGRIIDLYNDTIELEGGKLTNFDFILHRGAAAMIPVDQEGRLLMVRQYRNAVDQYTLEIPAGGLNSGEDMETCAIRECEEETGYKAGKVYHLLDLYTTVAFSNEKIGIYYTTDITPSKQNLDEDEYVNMERHSVEELTDLILQGKIVDAKTIAGILAYKEKLGL